MKSHPYQSDMALIERHYSDLLRQHGDSPQAVQYRDRETQELRFKILAEAGLPADAKVLDFGCGTGHLLACLRQKHQLTENPPQERGRTWPPPLYDQKSRSLARSARTATT